MATSALHDLTKNPKLVSYHDSLKHALWAQFKLRRDSEFRQPSWNAVVEALKNGEPVNVRDMLELMTYLLKDLQQEIRYSHKDSYQLFWNTGCHAELIAPKVEDVCRNALLNLLQPKLKANNINLQPEGHMAADKRADILALHSVGILPIEIKRHYHNDVWRACNEQLDRFYTCHPDAQGYGVYLILWFGTGSVCNPPKNPVTGEIPGSAIEMEKQLESRLGIDTAHGIKIFVLDVTKPF